MTFRTVSNDRLVDGEKLDLITVTNPINLDTISSGGVKAFNEATATITGNSETKLQVIIDGIFLWNIDNTGNYSGITCVPLTGQVPLGVVFYVNVIGGEITLIGTSNYSLISGYYMFATNGSACVRVN